MKIAQSHNCLSTDVQALIEPPPIPLIKVDLEEERASNIIKVKMRRNPALAASETYELKMATFENGQPEEFLALLKNFKIAINGTGTTSVAGWINYLRTILRAEALK